jgi:hypothetical protein
MAEESKIVEQMTQGAIKGIWQIVVDWWNGKKKESEKSAESQPSDDRSILIIGPGGTGKTTLAQLLSGNGHWLIAAPWEYHESHNVESYSLLDDPGVKLVVPPGQKHRREATWSTIQADLASDRYRGIIFVTANGYHNLMSLRSYKQHTLYKKDKDRFLESYTAECREEEVRVLQNVLNGMTCSGKKLWFLSIVAKQDLWFPNRAAAEKHYREGRYAELIGEVQRKSGAASFRHEIEFVSFVICNLKTLENETLQKNTEGYDHQLQVESVRRLIQTLHALKTWEEQQ